MNAETIRQFLKRHNMEDVIEDASSMLEDWDECIPGIVRTADKLSRTPAFQELAKSGGVEDERIKLLLAFNLIGILVAGDLTGEVKVRLQKLGVTIDAELIEDLSTFY
jgi:hypothetical protein